MKSVLYPGLIILTISSFINCEKGMNPFIPNNGSDSFYPLHIGNQWTYSNQWTYNGQFQNTESVVDSATFNGLTYFNIEGSHVIQPDFWIRESDNAVYFFDPESNNEHILFDFRAKSGDSWDMPDGFGCTVGDRIELLSDSETISAPIGTFHNCYHFHHKTRCMDGGLRDTWFVKGIGVVKSVQDSWFGYQEYLLVSYSFTKSIEY
ncbi:MAG: hypothetical protein V1800_01115 [Candidatus Latescibacterota bacterium]